MEVGSRPNFWAERFDLHLGLSGVLLIYKQPLVTSWAVRQMSLHLNIATKGSIDQGMHNELSVPGILVFPNMLIGTQSVIRLNTWRRAVISVNGLVACEGAATGQIALGDCLLIVNVQVQVESQGRLSRLTKIHGLWRVEKRVP